MVRGLDVFTKYFELYPDNYVIIGGTACDIIVSESGFRPRATRDIDIILVVEALDSAFARQFWNFVNEGKYEVREKSDPERQYYRFKKPANTEFPYQIELFSRVPDVLDVPEQSRYTPIPIDEDITSLSAILMNEDYYQFTIAGSKLLDGIRIANIETIICLKAKAYIDLKAAKERGEKIDSDKINTHKLDVFRLAVFLAEGNLFELPESIKTDLQAFADMIKFDLPGNAIFKEMGLGNINVDQVFNQLIQNFNLTN
ncbi:MAG TPA: hypothetical protein DCR40_12780 [Prolixibacteraceae bacterium]|nr:hypothetical protein [Prolixibacteraceae bacterium]